MTWEWNFRQSMALALQQWPKIAAFFLAGALLGWGVGLLWPTPMRASVELYVALNPYRAYDDSEFVALAKPKYSNLDDYKNWQMSELQTAIFLDVYLEDTLTRLQVQDAYWKAQTIEDLRDRLSAEWRSAGKWTLFAEDADAQRARQAADMWGVVVLERTDAAILAAQKTFMTDTALQEVIRQQEQMKTDLAQGNAAEKDLQDLQARRVVLEDEFRTAKAASLGLAPTLEVQDLQSLSTEAVRPSALLALIGGVIGLCVWAYLELARITRSIAGAAR